MKKILMTFFLIICKTSFADGSGIYVLEIEICTKEEKIITGFIKINDYVIDNYLVETKPETIKDLLISHVQYTKKLGEFSYFKTSICYPFKLNLQNEGINIYQLQDEKSISVDKIMSISILEKKYEPKEHYVLTKLNTDNQFWKEKEPIEIIQIGGDNYCQKSVIIYSSNNEIEKKLVKQRTKLTEDLFPFFSKQIENGEQIVIVDTCSE